MGFWDNWNTPYEFTLNVSDATTAVEDLVSVEAGSEEIYTMSGVRVSADREQLPVGLYIKKSAKGAQKIRVR